MNFDSWMADNLSELESEYCENNEEFNNWCREKYEEKKERDDLR